MILDSSAVIAIVFGEPGFENMAVAMKSASSCAISAATLLELSMVATSHGGDKAVLRCDTFLRSFGIAVEPFTEDQALIARQAFSDFGKGRHSAALNFGDCFSYALSKSLGEPLLFKGDDFRKTDVTPAI